MAQQVLEAGYSYNQQQFVGFYDALVSECYGGTAAEDEEYYAELLLQKLATSLPASSSTACSTPTQRTFVAVDLGCGTGRATLAVLNCLAEHGAKHAFSSSSPGALPWLPGVQLHIYCIDNSQPMLSAAEAKVNAHLSAHPCPAVTVKFLLESFQDWHLPAPDVAADFIMVAAAGLHHVLETPQLQTCMQRMARQLRPDGLCVVSYLPWTELSRAPEAAPAGQSSEEFQVAGYRRRLVNRTLTTASTPKAQSVEGMARVAAPCQRSKSDSSDEQSKGNAAAGSAVPGSSDGAPDTDETYKVLDETFTLTKFASSADGRQGPTGTDGGFATEDGCSRGVEWSIQESWQLRQIEREDLLRWGSDAGLGEASGCCAVRISNQHGGTSCIVFKQLQP